MPINLENVKTIVGARLIAEEYDGLTDGEEGEDCCSCIAGDTGFMRCAAKRPAMTAVICLKHAPIAERGLTGPNRKIPVRNGSMKKRPPVFERRIGGSMKRNEEKGKLHCIRCSREIEQWDMVYFYSFYKELLCEMCAKAEKKETNFIYKKPCLINKGML